MEWLTVSTFIGFLQLLALGGWTVYTYRQNRADKEKDSRDQTNAGITTTIVADGTSIRKDLREMLEDERARSDKFEGWLIAARDDINELKAKVNNLSFLKLTLEREKEALIEKNRVSEEREQMLAEENTKLHQEVKDLRVRIVELERKVDGQMNR